MMETGTMHIHERSCHPVYMKRNIVHCTITASTALTTENSQKVEDQVKEILWQNGYGTKQSRCWKR